MSTLLLNMRNVPDDEADEVRALLDEHGIDYYETQPSFWGMSFGGIWLRDDARKDEAKTLLKEYHLQRAERMRALYEQRQRDGDVQHLGKRLVTHPLRSLAVIAIIVFLCLVSLMPFILLARDG